MATTVVGQADLNKLAKDLAAASGESFKQAASELVGDAANQMLMLAQAYAPRRTGNLANSFVLTRDGLTATVANTAPYALYDEFGTGPRGEFPRPPIVIVPKRAKYLKFKTADGRTIFTKKVVSRGMAPRPFMRPALERVIVPLGTAFGDQAVAWIIRGPQAPETLTNAPATGWH